jgi:hypothetical protein
MVPEIGEKSPKNTKTELENKQEQTKNSRGARDDLWVVLPRHQKFGVVWLSPR